MPETDRPDAYDQSGEADDMSYDEALEEQAT